MASMLLRACSILDDQFDTWHELMHECWDTLSSSTDTDECAQSGNPCQENAECKDVEGGFMCQCQPGYEDVESTCFSEFPSMVDFS